MPRWVSGCGITNGYYTIGELKELVRFRLAISPFEELFMCRFQSSISVVCCLLLVAPYAGAQTARMPGSQSNPPQLETGSSHFSWLTGPYTRPQIAPIDLANSNRLESLLRAGKLY